MRINREEILFFTPGGRALIHEIMTQCMISDADVKPNPLRLLLISSSPAASAMEIQKKYGCSVIGISEDAEAILESKSIIGRDQRDNHLTFKYMSPIEQDFTSGCFDIILLEGQWNIYPKHKLLKECFRLLTDDGKLAITDSCWKKIPVPQYVRDVWEMRESPIPLFTEIPAVLLQSGFEAIWDRNVSFTLEPFYTQYRQAVQKKTRERETSSRLMKSLMIKYRHEISVYTEQNGHKWMGYFACVAKKKTP